MGPKLDPRVSSVSSGRKTDVDRVEDADDLANKGFEIAAFLGRFRRREGGLDKQRCNNRRDRGDVDDAFWHTSHMPS